MSTTIEEAGFDLPIALRRGKRRSTAISPVKHSGHPQSGDDNGPASYPTEQAVTPSKHRSQKRVRFSDPGLYTAASTSTTTGLTPYVRRACLATPRRRVSAPVSTPSSTSYEVQFTPFKQVLDDRSKRRIRRNGLSEETNDYAADRKQRVDLEKEVQAKDDELKLLREQLDQAKRTSTDNVLSVDTNSSSQRIDEVEAELAALRESFNGAVFDQDDLEDVNWDHVNIHKAGATPGPPSEGGDTILIYEDEDAMIVESSNNTDVVRDSQPDAELVAMALDLETAKQEKRQLFQELRHHMPGRASTDLNFADSPSRRQQPSDSHFLSPQSPPKDFLRNISAVIKNTTSRAEDAEVALHALEVEIKTLGFAGSDSATIIAETASHFRKARLELERTIPGETVSGFENVQVLPELITKLKILVKQVRDRELELKTMRDQQKTLKGNFEHSIVAAEKANVRVHELEEAIDTGAEEMLGMRMKVQALEKDGVEKDKNNSSLIKALERYREDVTRLEQLVTQMEEEMPFKLQEAKDVTLAEMEDQFSWKDAKIAAEEHGRRAAETSAVERLAKIEELQSTMETAQRHAMDVQLQLNVIRGEKEEEEFKLKKKLYEKDEQAQAQMGALNSRISNLSTALASANAEVDKLKVHKVKLEERVKKEVEQGERAVEVMQTELLRSLAKVNESKNSYIRGAKIRVANGELRDAEEDDVESGAEPMTPVSLVRFVDIEAGEEHVQGSVELRRGKRSGGKRKRRFDSGVGMDTLSEGDETDGPVELSSEADYEMEA